jgi:hypothetical protein
MLERAERASHTLIHQRHLTPSCRGQAPTAERTLDPARMFTGELESRPGIREPPLDCRARSRASCRLSTSSLLFDRAILFMRPPHRHAMRRRIVVTHYDDPFAIGQTSNVMDRSHIPYLRTTQRPQPHVNLQGVTTVGQETIRCFLAPNAQ